MKCPHCNTLLSAKEAQAPTCPICRGTLAAAPTWPTHPAGGSAAPATTYEPARQRELEPPRPIKPIRPWARRIGGGFVLLLGALFLWMTCGEFVRWLGSFGWPATMATVEESGVTEYLVTTRRGSRWTEYRPAVTYNYEVGGHKYKSSTMQFGRNVGASNDTSGLMSKDTAQRIANRYRKGSSVKAYYDPANPEFAVLSRTMEVPAWSMLGLSLVFFYAGLRLFTSALLSGEAAARTRIWLFDRGWNKGDLVAGGIPFALFAVCQFFPFLLHW